MRQLQINFNICIKFPKSNYINLHIGPGDYCTNIGNLAFESAKRFKEKHKKIIDYLNFYVTSTSVNDISFNEECALSDKRKIIDEEKCAVYHAVFKSRVKRFAKIYKDVSIKTFIYSWIYIAYYAFALQFNCFIIIINGNYMFNINY